MKKLLSGIVFLGFFIVIFAVWIVIYPAKGGGYIPVNLTNNTPKEQVKSHVNVLVSPTLSPIILPTVSAIPTSIPTLASSQFSKTGIFILTHYSDGAKKIIQAKPNIIKVMDPQLEPNLMVAVEEYKRLKPDGIVILRISKKTVPYTLSDDPVISASSFHTQVIAPVLLELGEKRQLFDYIETPNEVENTPNWETVESVAWLDTFWSRLIDLNRAYKIKSCVASIPVGNPGGDPSQITEKMKAFSKTLDKTISSNGAICYHGYSLEYTTDVGVEYWFSLRYRMLHKIMMDINPVYESIQFIISEAGVDQSGNPQSSGWKSRGDEEKYKTWLTWYDKEISMDSYVIGATIFQIGDNYWSSFNIDPLAEWFAGRL
ncbi:MAG: hypothetical protein WCO06_01990 [Candidatus Roizmanbacteria bacterium]